jgi:hypothetical protein
MCLGGVQCVFGDSVLGGEGGKEFRHVCHMHVRHMPHVVTTQGLCKLLGPVTGGPPGWCEWKYGMGWGVGAGRGGGGGA